MHEARIDPDRRILRERGRNFVCAKSQPPRYTIYVGEYHRMIYLREAAAPDQRRSFI
jgi:hypothetical protein